MSMQRNWRPVRAGEIGRYVRMRRAFARGIVARCGAIRTTGASAGRRDAVPEPGMAYMRFLQVTGTRIRRECEMGGRAAAHPLRRPVRSAGASSLCRYLSSGLPVIVLPSRSKPLKSTVTIPGFSYERRL